MREGLGGTGTTSALRLAEVLATRLCHDLGGPLAGLVGAMGEVPADPAALDLARDATALLRRRMALLRAAWGVPGPAQPGAELLALTAGLPLAHKLRVEMAAPVTAATLPPEFARTLLNAVILAGESLPLGGTITVLGDPGEAVMLTIEGPRTAWPPGLGAMLADAEAAWAATDAAAGGVAALRGVQAAITALLAHAAGIHARLLLGPGTEPAPPLLLEASRP